MKATKEEKEKARQQIEELINKIKNEGGLKKIDLGELIKPEKYAHIISKGLELSRVQLRRIYTEFKNIYDTYQNSKKSKEVNVNKIKSSLYKLYPILQYQASRQIIDDKFKELMWKILDSLEKDPENFDNTMEFIKALVAYSPKE